MLWLLPLALVVAGSIVLAVLAARLRREILPTERALESFGRTLVPALVRVRNETTHTRARYRSDR